MQDFSKRLPRNVVWYSTQKYGTDGDYIYRFNRDGTLDKQPIYNRGLSAIGEILAEDAKKHW